MLWLWLAFSLGLGQACEAQSDIGGVVAGRVVGPDGRGIGGALVRIDDEGTGEHIDVRSDRRGNFHLRK